MSGSEVTALQIQLLAIPGVADVGSHIGTAPLGEEINGVNFSESWLSLSPGADYPKVLDEVRAVASSHPGAFSDVQTYLHERIDEVLTNGTTDDIVVRVYGSGVSELGALGNQLAAVLARVPGLTDVHPAALEFIPQIDVQVNLAAARRYGLTPGVIRRAAAITMASEPMSEISSGGVLTLATALALLPLVLYGNRPGQEIEYPMAIVILGGLATSTLLNLFVLPVLYLSIGRRRHERPSP